ncbi:MAG: DegV family EDD domain-containing protein [Gammaproteobacteria bacterium]|nr:DegV family EDD domain-containing protein [Gammaproteobacteria bacterium]MBU2678470.1 DegV family EDD domain-containing protein [Gammaproteobacteria bacterium]NNL52205.1 DegV family EDD domain-containing protein [Woeseiaceae bacterium]
MTGPLLKHLDGDMLAIGLTSGIHRVLREQELLNRINVFPVADSDTGTNLSLTLGSALGVLSAPDGKHLGTMLAAVADALLDGARGNSGAIVAQFFQGMSDSAGEITRFTTYTFGKAVSLGSEYAHDALSKPRDGTILSVVAAFAQSITHQLSEDRQSEFSLVLGNAQQRVEEALANTPNQLEVLRKAGVVDAGAKGFAELVAGLSDYLRYGTVVSMPDSSLHYDNEPIIDFAEADNESQFRFCTECIVTAADIDRRKLREGLAEIGDSLVLAGTKRKAKIHIHVDDPDAVFEIAGQFGDVSAEKADDMHRQQHSTHETKRRFAVITDSAADIPDDAMERLDIHIVPCRIQFGSRGYLDKVSITTEEFYAELKSNPHHPTTSQPAPGDFRRQFQFLASHFDDVLSINLTSAASGTYEAARLAATRTNAAGRIHVIDSKNASMGQGQLVALAAECANNGANIDTTIALVSRQVPQVRSFALLRDLRYAVRGGRLPTWVMTIANLLRLKPIISTKPDGSISLASFLLGTRNRTRRYARFIARRVPRDTPVDLGIGHAICEEEAMALEQALRERIPTIRNLTVNSLGTALGVHGGPGTLLVSFGPYVSAQDVAGSLD